MIRRIALLCVVLAAPVFGQTTLNGAGATFPNPMYQKWFSEYHKAHRIFSSTINPSEAVEEKVSLSDRFGLWLGFHRCSQDEYLAMVEGYVAYYKIPRGGDALRHEALEWATTRGSRSGRVAWQFIQDLAGRLGVALSD